MGRGGLDRKAAVACGCVGLIGIILAISLTAASFKTVDETDMCIRRNDVTRVVSSTVELPGTRYYGLSTTLICYPRLLIAMNLAMQARSRDGLELDLTVDVEYRLQTQGLKQLYDKVGLDYEPLYRDLAGSSLRNTASKFNAIDFLGGTRSNISAPMREALTARLIDFHADVVNTNLRNVSLDFQFESKFRSIENARLQTKKIVAARPTRRSEQESKEEREMSDLQIEREEDRLQAQTDVKSARLKREEETTRFANLKVRRLERAETEREKVFTEARTSVDRVKAERDSILARKANELTQRKIELETQKRRARTNANVAALSANSSATVLINEGEAAADGILAFGNAQVAEFKGLQDVGMNTSDVLKYHWVTRLREMDRPSTYLDYRKISLFLEGTPDPSAALRAITGGSLAG